MEDPVKEVPHLIHTLTESPIEDQQAAIQRYFLADASFRHIVCRVQHFRKAAVPFLGDVNSRWAIGQIYYWYKTLSPSVTVDIHSVSFDEKNLLVYISMQQHFSLFILPGYSAWIPLVTVLHLKEARSDGNLIPNGCWTALFDYQNGEDGALSPKHHKQPNHYPLPNDEKEITALKSTPNLCSPKTLYHISSQEDFYQPEEFLKFFWPGGHYLVEWWQAWNSIVSVVCALTIVPIIRLLMRITKRVVGYRMD